MVARSISAISTDRPTLHAFEISGKISKPDIEWMASTLKTAFETQGLVDIIIIITRWDGIDLGAMFDTQSMSVQAQANSHVRKYAVVGAPAWAEAMIKLFSPLTPVEEQTFDLSQAEQAWLWVSA